MKSPGLELKLSQQLTLTPQLRQALRVLQMSTLELKQTTLTALENNVMLEIEERESEPSAQDEDASETGAEDEPIDFNDDSRDQVETDWDTADIWASESGLSAPAPSDQTEIAAPAGESLHEHLLWQIELMHFTETDAMIALALIDGIDERGYLSEDFEQVIDALPADLDINTAEIEMVLHRIQTLDPVGIGARNLSECLQIQLRHLDAQTRGRDLALTIAEHYLEHLAGQNFEWLKKELAADRGELTAAIALIRTLHPEPGATIGERPVDYVIPDVLVSRQDGRWLVELNPEVAPHLRVNALYASCLDREQRTDSTRALRQNLQEARWFIRSVQMRNDTLLRVACAIVEHQQAFLAHGEEAMRPLVLKDIAARLEMHESTISRVTTRKYMLTSRGTFEFKYFFSAQVGVSSGDEHSATSIRATIRKLIAAESPHRPLSDGKITAALREQGIKVARRTTAKYRESMAIPASHERKR